jgi:hypothetical protein
MRFSANGLWINQIPQMSPVDRTFAEMEVARIAASVSLVLENWNTKIFLANPLASNARWASMVPIVTMRTGIAAAKLVALVHMELTVHVFHVQVGRNIKIFQGKPLARNVRQASMQLHAVGAEIAVAGIAVKVLTALAVNVNIVTGPWSIKTKVVKLVAKLVRQTRMQLHVVLAEIAVAGIAEEVLTLLAVNVNVVTGSWSIRTKVVQLVAKLVRQTRMQLDVVLAEIAVAGIAVKVLTLLAVNVNIVTGSWSIRTKGVQLVAKLVLQTRMQLDVVLAEIAVASIILTYF